MKEIFPLWIHPILTNEFMHKVVTNFRNPPLPPLEKEGGGDLERIPVWFWLGWVRLFWVLTL
jgi:hypothetical protein